MVRGRADRLGPWRFAGPVLCVVAVTLGPFVPWPVLAAGQPSSGPAATVAHHESRNTTFTPPFVIHEALPYGDCSGATPLARTAIYRDACLSGIYLVAHNPGPFAAILALKVGSRVSYRQQLYAITSITLTTTAVQWNRAQSNPAQLTLQTCANDAQARVWVFRADTDPAE